MTRRRSRAAFAAVSLGAVAITVVRVRAATPETSADAAAEIQRLEQELARAVVAIDVQAIRRIEAEGYVYTDSEANVGRREELHPGVSGREPRAIAVVRRRGRRDLRGRGRGSRVADRGTGDGWSRDPSRVPLHAFLRAPSPGAGRRWRDMRRP